MLHYTVSPYLEYMYLQLGIPTSEFGENSQNWFFHGMSAKADIPLAFFSGQEISGYLKSISLFSMISEYLAKK